MLFKRRKPLGLAATLILSFCFATLAAAQDAKLHFINVGKGDANLLEFPCGAMMVDTGGGEESEPALIAYLDSFFAARPDLGKTLQTVVLTHGHLDHTRNFEAILQRYRIKTVVANGHFKKRGYRGLLELLRAYPDTRLIVSDAEWIERDGLWDKEVDQLDCDSQLGGRFPDIRLIWGDARPQLPGWSKKFYKDENNHSVSVLLRWGDQTALYTGDLEKRGLQELLKRQGHILRDIDVYQISHHGFRSGTTPGFLEHLNPRIAILSRPFDRAWHEPTMDRFNETVRDRRTPLDVPVWNPGKLINSDDDEDRLNEDAKTRRKPNRKRERPEKTGTLTGAIFWTGRDGTTRITLSGEPDLALEFGE